MVILSFILLGVSLCTLIFLFCVFDIHTYVWSVIEDRPHTLTPFLNENKISEAQKQSRIIPDILNNTCFSGFFSVNNECESNLFFWFCQAQTDWEQAPVLLWLQGGPGCSSLFGLLKEIGPFYFKDEIARENYYSWNKISNLLFIDQPVGTGFSFTDQDCYARNKTEIATDLYSAILQFYQLFPNLRRNKFYIAGESYAGHYIPYIAHFIHKNKPTEEYPVEISGLMIGNGWMDAYYQYNRGKFLYNLGLADERQKQTFQQYHMTLRQYLIDKDWASASDTSNEIFPIYTNVMEGIDFNNLLEDEKDVPPCRDEINGLDLMKKSIHVGSTEFGTDVDRVHWNLVYDNTYDVIQSTKVEIEELLEHYPIVFYFGQLDTLCPYSTALSFLRDLRWSGADNYKKTSRSRWCVNGQLAGFYRSSHNLHKVLVRNAGHSVPIDQPLWAFILAQSVTSSPPGDPLHNLTSC